MNKSLTWYFNTVFNTITYCWNDYESDGDRPKFQQKSKIRADFIQISARLPTPSFVTTLNPIFVQNYCISWINELQFLQIWKIFNYYMIVSCLF